MQGKCISERGQVAKCLSAEEGEGQSGLGGARAFFFVRTRKRSNGSAAARRSGCSTPPQPAATARLASSAAAAAKVAKAATKKVRAAGVASHCAQLSIAAKATHTSLQ